VTFVASTLISRMVFERLPHLEDEITYLFQAELLARGQTVIPSPQPSGPFWKPFVKDFNGLRFGKYSLGWPGLLAVGVNLGQPWIVNAWLSALSIALVYRLGKEIFTPDVGLIAALLMTASPMALLLNATFMGHTAALTTSLLFLYAYWRMERTPQYAKRWALLAGIGLGLTVINRPLAGVALAAPLIIWSGVRLYWRLREGLNPSVRFMQHLHPVLMPLLIVAFITALFTAVIPAYNYAATGNPTQNLYLLIWDYDRIGFGEGYGRNGHTLEKGLRQTWWDLSLANADVFGWQCCTISDSLRIHWLQNSDWFPNIGLSFILLPVGILLILRQHLLWGILWIGTGVVAYLLLIQQPITTLREPTIANLFMLELGLWIALPWLVILLDPPPQRMIWGMVLITFLLTLVGLHITYWIGSQRYSTRYYFEALPVLALLTALPLAWLMQRGEITRRVVWGGLLAVTLLAFITYSWPRVQALYRFNWVSPELIQAVERHREDDRPVLVLVSGEDVRWRALGALMIHTSPWLDSDIVAAWDNLRPGTREAILGRFPDRQLIEMTASGNRSCFVESNECFGEPAVP
jgi:4-amino-4-deoxy-L-arabinose transferase-like glycosyltransferase